MVQNTNFYISVPPSKAIILDEKGSIVQGTIGPFNEQSTLILTCDVIGGKFFQTNFCFIFIQQNCVLTRKKFDVLLLVKNIIVAHNYDYLTK